MNSSSTIAHIYYTRRITEGCLISNQLQKILDASIDDELSFEKLEQIQSAAYVQLVLNMNCGDPEAFEILQKCDSLSLIMKDLVVVRNGLLSFAFLGMHWKFLVTGIQCESQSSFGMIDFTTKVLIDRPITQTVSFIKDRSVAFAHGIHSIENAAKSLFNQLQFFISAQKFGKSTMGYLMCGASGTGKSHTVKQIAIQSGLPWAQITAKDIIRDGIIS